MAHEPGSQVPARVVVGDTSKWTRSVPGHPDEDGWELRVELARPGEPVSLVVTGTPDGDGWAFEMTAAQSATLLAGRYRWAEYLARDDERYTVASGWITMVDIVHESVASRMVRTIQEAMEDIIHGRYQQANINSRGKTLLSLEDLRRELNHWQAVLEQEERPGFGPKIAARFQQPGFPGRGFPFPGGLR